MNYSFSPFQTKTAEVGERLRKELAGIHTGRVASAILDGVSIESYGARTPIAHSGSIAVEDARTLRITPWDKTQIKAMERAVNDANLGVSVSSDATGLRVFFPELTTERRTALQKLVRGKLEEARVALRTEREKVWHDIQERERSGELSEDDKFRLKDELQKFVDEGNRTLESLAERKEKEIMG